MQNKCHFCKTLMTKKMQKKTIIFCSIIVKDKSRQKNILFGIVVEWKQPLIKSIDDEVWGVTQSKRIGINKAYIRVLNVCAWSY